VISGRAQFARTIVFRISANCRKIWNAAFRVGVSMDKFTRIPPKRRCRKSRFNYPVVLGDAKLGNLYGGVLGLPQQFLIGADGKDLGHPKRRVSPTALDEEICRRAQPS
jgi:hypothetical protein